jgi:tetratricopeptide (TPR) repeat protein
LTRFAAGAELRNAEAALAAGRFPEAVEILQKALRSDRDSPRLRLMLAYALWQSGQREQAILALRRLIERSPGNADAWFNLGNFYRAERRVDDAVRAFARAAQLQSGNAAAHVNLGYALVQAGRFEEAEAAVRSSLEIFPDEPDLLVNLAQIERATQRLEDALATLDRCVGLAPQHAGYRVTRALVRLDLDDPERALAELDGVIRDHPDCAEAHFAEARLYLSAGRYCAGWREYLWRPSRRNWLATQGAPATAAPPPLERLRGKSVVIVGEQGLGDIVFFLRFAPLLESVAGDIHLEVDPRLQAILPQRWSVPAASSAVRVLAGDLGAIVGTDDAVLSLSLQPAANRVEQARERLGRCGPAPYIGLTWQGGQRWEDMAEPGVTLFKRIAPAAFGASFSRLGGTLISLQRNPVASDLAEVAAAAGRQVHDFADVNADLPAALAVLSLLDDYVAVSNTNVHLRDALGKPGRVLVTHPAEWRWGIEGERSPWMRHARLYRQARNGAWDGTLARLEADLGVWA